VNRTRSSSGKKLCAKVAWSLESVSEVISPVARFTASTLNTPEASELTSTVSPSGLKAWPPAGSAT